ncbi:hypothetical protein HPP92_023579 [Vanilla planifolia]|uniref:Uncharacterized protein n=1 Tax=Vanilla planifolia TaxID=51239 RepID=A0A835PP67_VANPL|nr:hypothetical protein HPP92_023579 [Vanilla planifolia]
MLVTRYRRSDHRLAGVPNFVSRRHRSWGIALLFDGSGVVVLSSSQVSATDPSGDASSTDVRHEGWREGRPPALRSAHPSPPKSSNLELLHPLLRRLVRASFMVEGAAVGCLVFPSRRKAPPRKPWSFAHRASPLMEASLDSPFSAQRANISAKTATHGCARAGMLISRSLLDMPI